MGVRDGGAPQRGCDARRDDRGPPRRVSMEQGGGTSVEEGATAVPSRTTASSTTPRFQHPLDKHGKVRFTRRTWEAASAPQAYGQAGHAALELLELADVDGDRPVARAPRRARAVRGALAAISTGRLVRAARRASRAPPARRGTTTRRPGRPPAGSYPTTVPSGSAVTADLRCSTFVSGTATTRGAERRRGRRELVDAVGVGAPAEPDVDRAVVLEHVAAVEGAGRLDVRDPVAQAAQRLLGARGLRLALVGARAGDHGQVARTSPRCPRRRPSPGSRAPAAPRRSPSPRPAARRRTPPTAAGPGRRRPATRSMWVSRPSARRGLGRRTRARRFIRPILAAPRPPGEGADVRRASP